MPVFSVWQDVLNWHWCISPSNILTILVELFAVLSHCIKAVGFVRKFKSIQLNSINQQNLYLYHLIALKVKEDTWSSFISMFCEKKFFKGKNHRQYYLPVCMWQLKKKSPLFSFEYYRLLKQVKLN
jgi:hypothetical protein